MKLRSRNKISCAITIIFVFYVYKVVNNKLYDHQTIFKSFKENFNEKTNFENDMKELEKNLSIYQNKIKKLEDERLLMENSLEPDVKLRIESLKTKNKIRNIIAYVFFGRREYTKILFRYLDSNLKENGGILDKIVLIEHLLGTEKTENKKFLKEYLAKHKTGYELIPPIGDHRFTQLYTILHDDDLIFKIDDDTVFVANGTFESMVEDYLKNDRFITSANVVNHHTFSAIHRNMNFLVPFHELGNATWIQGSVVPKNNDTTMFEKCNTKRVLNWRENSKCAAISHENLLYHVYKNKFNLTLYDFKTYDINSFNYEAWRINFILFRGNVVNKMNIKYKHIKRDEEIITEYLPRDSNKHCFGVGAAVVSHFAYSTDGNYEYLSKTDILSKYDKLSIDYFRK